MVRTYKKSKRINLRSVAVIVWSWGSVAVCRADVGLIKLQGNCPQVSQLILAPNFSLPDFFGLVSPGLQAPPQEMPKIVGIPLQLHIFEQKHISRRVTPYGGDPKPITEGIRAPCLQNETAPEKLLNRYEKRFENAKKDPKNDPKHVWKMFSPSQAA